MEIEFLGKPRFYFSYINIINVKSSPTFCNSLWVSQLPSSRMSQFFVTYLITPYNVGSLQWRLFSTLEVVRNIMGITSVVWGIASVLQGDSFSTVEVAQYMGG